MIDHEGKVIDQALPSMPVEILGMNDTAYAGAEFLVTENENKAKEISEFNQDSSSKKKILLNDKPTLFENGQRNSKISAEQKV